MNKSTKTILEKYGPDHFQKIGRKGGQATGPNKGKGSLFNDKNKAREAVNKRWEKYRRLKEEADEWNN